jgi:hypothetical protein
VGEQRPARGGAFEWRGRLDPQYAPQRDGDPDPGEVVWTWVPYEEDPSQGKDRPVVVIGRDADDDALLVALMLSSKDHDGDHDWFALGAGPWDVEHRPSWVRLDRTLAVTEDGVRREGAALPRQRFLDVVEHAVARDRARAGGSRRPAPPRSAHAPAPAPAGRRSLADRLRSVFRRSG